jgi:hypothetical protein
MYICNVLDTRIIGSLICFIALTLFFRSKRKLIKRNGLFIKFRPEKKCFRCSGFGITRCSLCKGKGIVLYERKYLRFDPCPKCLQKRYDECHFCRGVGERIGYGKIEYKNIFFKIFRIFKLKNN